MGKISFIFEKIFKVIKICLNKLDRIFINEELCILSNNCWGGEVYRNLKIKYNTPTIGLYIYPDDFAFFIDNLDLFMKYKVSNSDFHYSNNIIVMKVFGVSVFFLHYSSVEEAVEKWNRRIERMRLFVSKHGEKKIIVKICECDEVISQYSLDFFYKLENRTLILRRSHTVFKFLKKFPNGVKLFNLRILYYRKYIKLFWG